MGGVGGGSGWGFVVRVGIPKMQYFDMITVFEDTECQNISYYEHPPTHKTYPKCHPGTVYVPIHPQTIMMSIYFILGILIQPSNMYQLSPCTIHITNHPQLQCH